MNKKDLVQSIATETGLKIKDAELAIKALMESIGETLATGEDVVIQNFCSFKTRKCDPRVARNPRTQEEISVPSQIKVVCKMSKAVKDMVNGGQI